VVELDVEEIGPSLRWATAKVSRAARNSATTGGSPAADPWGQPSAGAGGFSDDPPPF
jgi:single-strand DNA-binding protein